MNIHAFHNLHTRAYTSLREHRLLDAISQLEELAALARYSSAVEALYVLRQDYAMLLEYMKSGRDDNERQSHFEDFLRKAYKIEDRITRQFIVKHSDFQEAAVAKRLHQSAEDVANIYVPFVEGKNGRAATIAQIISDPLASYQQLFDTVWVSGQWTEGQRREFESYVLNDANPRLNRMVLVSAAGMALFLTFDEQKFLFLLGVIEEHQVEVSIRALTFILLLFGKYSDRLSLYPTIQLKLKFLKELTYFHPLVVEVQKILLLAPKNPELAAKIDDELPDKILSAHEHVKEIPAEATEDDIETYFKENPKARRFHHEMLDMMHDFAVMQEKGVDLSYQTFSHMHPIVPFFREAANWFCPFSYDHPVLFNVNAAARFFSVVVNNKACDTERFAVFFTIAPHLPKIHVVQQDMLTMEEKNMEGDEAENFIEKLADQMEKQEAEGENSLLTIKPGRLHRYVVSCVQDCFRFFTLYGKTPEKNEKEGNAARSTVYPIKKAFSANKNPFEADLCFWLNDSFESIFAPEKTKRDFADWVFELEDYEGAISLYCSLPEDAEILQRKAFAYEQMGFNHVALTEYQRALEFDPDNEWTFNRLIDCLRENQMFSHAAELLEERSQKYPDDIHTSRLLAEMYMRDEEYEKAKSVYIKNDYLQPNHLPTLRGLAWCYLAIGDYQKADEYYLAILSSEKAQSNDFLNAGHCSLLRNDIPSALLYYQEYLHKKSLDYAPATLFDDDNVFLSARGVNATTQRLVIDLLNL